MGLDGDEQSAKPVGPITDIAPVLGLIESRLPSKDIVSTDPFGPGTKYWIVGGIGPVGEKDPVAKSIRPICCEPVITVTIGLAVAEAAHAPSTSQGIRC